MTIGKYNTQNYRWVPVQDVDKKLADIENEVQEIREEVKSAVSDLEIAVKDLEDTVRKIVKRNMQRKLQ